MRCWRNVIDWRKFLDGLHLHPKKPQRKALPLRHRIQSTNLTDVSPLCKLPSQSVEQTRLLDSINSILLNIDPSQASFKIPDLSNREALNSSFAADIAMRAESNAQLQAAIVNLTGEVQTIKNNVSEMLTYSVEVMADQQTIAESSSALKKNLPKITQALDGIKQNTNGLSHR